MKSFIIITVVVLASVCTCVVFADEATTLASAENPCASKFKEDAKRINVSESCVEKSGLKPEDMPHTEEEFVKTFNDKCYGKCLLSELGMLDGLTFKRDSIKSDILEHVLDKDFQTKITEYTMKCLDDAEKDAGKITEDNICKVSAQLLYCCKKEEQKLVC